MAPSGARGGCLGLRARTARAVGVVVLGPARSPRAVSRLDIALLPDGSAPRQPYHDVMGLPWPEAVVAVRGAEKELEVAATGTLRATIRELRARGLDVASVAIVGAPERRLASIGSPHIRAHAAEGVLFRRVWQVAAESLGMPSETFSEKGIELSCADRLGLTVEDVRARLVELGRALGRPWRADEKAATMAAWMALSSSSETSAT